MRTRPAGKNRTKLLLVILVALIAGGYATYRWNLGRQAGPGAYALAKSAFEKGQAAYASNDPTGAVVQFDDAAKHTEKAIATLDTRSKLLPKAAEERLQFQGELFWLKARILRDRAFADAAVGGQPIPETLDSSTGEKYRAYTAIPDLAARSAAVAMVRGASERLNDNAELILDSLRIELVMQPMQWLRIEKLCMMSLKVNKDDARALYFLAKFEFDQPGSDGEAGSLTYENRDPTRISRAKEYMAAARKAGAPYWRSIHLEAEILNWLSKDARKRDPVRANAYQEELRALISGQPDGAMERAKRGDQWKNLSIHDVRAIATIPAFALELASEDPAQVRIVVGDALSIFERLCNFAGTPQAIAEAGEGTIETLVLASATLARHHPAGWAAFIERAEGLFAKSPYALGRPAAAMKFAKLYAQLPGAAEPSRIADPRTVQILRQALTVEKELRTPPAKQIELQIALLDSLALQEAPVAEIQTPLAALRLLNEPLAKAAVIFHEAVLVERTGAILAARKKYEPLVDNKASAEITARAFAALANITCDAEEYNNALAYLRETASALAKADQSPWELAWLARLAGSREEVTVRQILAIYELGRARVVHWQRSNPGRLPPEELRQLIEPMATPLAKRLTSPGDADRVARQARIRFLVAANQQTLAEKQFALLTVDYPKHADVLTTAAQVWAAPKPGELDPDATAISKIDALVAEFLRANPESQEAKAFQLEWMLNTNRRSDALAYLRSPAHFVGRVDPLLESAVSGELYGRDGLDDVSTILAVLPIEPGVTKTLIAGILSGNDSTLAFQRRATERQRQVIAAWRLFLDGKYEPAAEAFLTVMDNVSVRPAARAGLARCLLQYADADNAKAGAFLAKLQTRYPEEPSIFLAAALAALRNEDVGEETDAWGNSKSMWAALNRWQLIARAYGVPTTTIAAMKMRFLLLAGRFENAIQIPRQFTKTSPDDPALLLLQCEMHLAGPYRDLDAARKDLAKAFATVPDEADRFHQLEIRLFIETGDFDAARRVCDLNVVNNPQSGTAFAQLIEVARLQKDNAGAMAAAFRWPQEQPANPQAITALISQLYRSVAESAAKPAAEEFVRAANLRGKTFCTAALLAVAEGYLGHDDAETDRWLRRVLEVEPAHPKGQYLAGQLSERRGDFDAALKHYEAATNAKPRDLMPAARAMRILREVKLNPDAAFQSGLRARTVAGGNRLVAPERLPAEFLVQWGSAALAGNNRDRQSEASEGLLRGALHFPGDPHVLLVLAELQNAMGEGTRAAENLAIAKKLAADEKSGLSPQDRRDTLEKVEAARKKIRE